jgi:hypothetical protein
LKLIKKSTCRRGEIAWWEWRKWNNFENGCFLEIKLEMVLPFSRGDVRRTEGYKIDVMS